MSQKRYLGLELTGAKNQKTALAVLEFFPKEGKTFLLDVQTGIGYDRDHDSDQVITETLLDHMDPKIESWVGANVPLTLTPCVECTRKTCPLPKHCTVPEVKWMRNHSPKNSPENFITPYTQRPVDIWIRNEVLPEISSTPKFGVKLDLDETLGSNKAPLTARMAMIKKHLPKIEFLEVMPKLTLAQLAIALKIPSRWTQTYRQLEDGIYAREMILEKLIEHFDLFIYERDLKKITQHLNAFDAFICALTVKLVDLGKTMNPPKGFPASSGWVHFPRGND